MNKHPDDAPQMGIAPGMEHLWQVPEPPLLTIEQRRRVELAKEACGILQATSVISQGGATAKEVIRLADWLEGTEAWAARQYLPSIFNIGFHECGDDCPAIRLDDVVDYSACAPGDEADKVPDREDDPVPPADEGGGEAQDRVYDDETP